MEMIICSVRISRDVEKVWDGICYNYYHRRPASSQP